MEADSKGWLCVPSGFVEGPLPAHPGHTSRRCATSCTAGRRTGRIVHLYLSRRSPPEHGHRGSQWGMAPGTVGQRDASADVRRFGYIAKGKIAMWCSSRSVWLLSVFAVTCERAGRAGVPVVQGRRGRRAVGGVGVRDGRDGQVFHGTSKLGFGGLHDPVYFHPATGEVAVNTLPSRSEQLTDDVKIRSLIDLAYARIPPLGFIFASFPA